MSALPQVALVVDDEAHNCDFAMKLLERAGLQVYSAADATQAIDVIQKHAEITLAVIDHNLPGISGVTLIRTLRNSHPDMLLVMATMHDDSETIDRAFDAGANMFIVKPNGFIELYRGLLRPDLDILNSNSPLVIDAYGPRKYKKPRRALPEN